MAAKRSSADADTSKQFCLIPHTDLTKLDTCLKYGCQIFYQITEIDSAVRREIKQDFVVIESIFRIDQLHIQLMFADLLGTDTHSILFLCQIAFYSCIVIRCCDTHNGFQRLNYFVIRNLLWIGYDAAVFDSSCCLNDHMVSLFDRQFFRIKVINLPGRAKTDTNNFYHYTKFSFIRRNSSSMVRSKLTFAFRRVFAVWSPRRIFSIPS